jgi:phosphohistidine phosphatase
MVENSREETSAMLLYIVRHGIAIDREDPKCPSDPERYLTAEGITRTREVAKCIAALIDTPKVHISSPYVRAVQTAEIFADALRTAKAKIEKTELLLPGAEPSGFLRELSRRKSLDSAICFGHAPQLDELISAAVGAKKDLTELKKAGVACIEMSRVYPAAGKLQWLITPRIVRKLSKKK